MKECSKCKIGMIIIQDDTPNPYSWGGFRIYGCQKCHMLYYQHLDEEGKESDEISDEEIQKKKELEKKIIKRESQKKSNIKSKDLKRMVKNFDKHFPEVVKKRKWIKNRTMTQRIITITI